MVVKGYKAFEKGLINRYGKKFEIGKTYTVPGIISFGNNGNGFHFCKNLEDTFRYFDALAKEIEVAEVTGYGDIVTQEDEYNGFYDLYSASSIKIERTLTRKEIIETFLLKVTSEPRVKRFVQLFKLTEHEKEMFKLRYASSTMILDAIEYYQNGKKDTYEKKYKVKGK